MEEQCAKKKRSHPLAGANFFSRIFFLYTFNSIHDNFDTNILYNPLMCHKSELLGDRLERYKDELYKQTLGTPMVATISLIVSLIDLFLRKFVYDIICAVPSDKIETMLNTFNGYNEDIQFTVKCEKLLSWSRRWKGARSKINSNILLKSIFLVFWQEFLKTVIISFLEIILRIAEPVCLSYAFSYFQPNSTMSQMTVLYWSIGMLASIGLRIFVHAQQRCQSLYTSTKIQVACSNLVYRKALRVKSKNLQEDGGIKIITLIANDLSKCDMKTELINYVYTAPFAVIAVMFIMYQDFGIPGLVGIICIISITPLQVFSSSYIANLSFLAMQLTGERMRLMHVLFNGINIVKMFVWEDSLAKAIDKVRTKELTTISKSFLLKAISGSVNIFIVPICLFLSLYAVILAREDITVFMIFVMIFYYTLLNYIVSISFTIGLAKLFEILGALKRVNDFLNMDELKPTNSKTEEYIDKVFIRLDNITVTFDDFQKNAETDESLESTDSTEKTALLKEHKRLSTSEASDKSTLNDEYSGFKDLSVLRNISLNIEGDQFLGVIGPVGSGKSLILQLMLGELLISCGSKNISGKISYASQVPWIFSANIRQNILFGLEYDELRYSEVVRVCGLENDFRKFPQTDSTLIGNKGAHLSIGQQTRINLARAVYRKADIYLLDDPFSGVDMQMANYLLEECILGYLKNECRIVATFHINHLRNADNIIHMNKGRITKEGSYEDMKRAGLLCEDFRLAITQHLHHADTEEVSSIIERDIFHRRINLNQSFSESIASDADDVNEKSLLCQEPATKLYKPYNVEKGRVVIFEYLLASNRKFALVTIILLFIMNQIIISGIFYYLGEWSSAEEIRNSFQFLSPMIFYLFGLRSKLFYENWFGVLIIILMVTASVKTYFYSSLVKSDSKTTYDNLLKKVIRTNLTFYHTQKVQILGKFSKEMNIVDEEIPESLMESSQFILMTAGSFVLLILVHTNFAVPAVILLLLIVALLFVFSKSLGDIMRKESKLFSQNVEHLSMPAQGIITARALSAGRILVEQFENHQDNYSSCWFSYGLYSIAMSFYVDLTCFMFLVYVTVVLVFQAESLNINSGFVGVAFIQVLSLIGVTQYGIRQALDVRNQLRAFESISRYRNLENEKDPQFSIEPPSQWPDEGNIVFKDVCLRYDTDSPLVLKHLSFVINSREKIGIVGSTGAGKSSIIAAMFRLFDVEGCIEIDGFDTRDISLNLLRSKISVIPQEPVLFAANLRFNLDPFNGFDDDILYRTVRALDLKDPSGQLYDLDYMIADRGSNLSVGQRQLICLARALVRNNKILILDDATQHIDPGTDELIQKTIRREFSDSTILTITDRLNTLVHSDKLLVMESGRLQEFGHPHLLLQNANGKFYQMINKAGPAEVEKFKNTAFENYVRGKTH